MIWLLIFALAGIVFFNRYLLLGNGRELSLRGR